MIAALLLLAADAADTAPAQAKSLQQRFDEASAMFDAGDCAKAIPAFEALKAEPAFRPTGLGGAVLLVRQGECLVQTGFFDFGQKQIEQGLPLLRKQGDQFAIDVANAVFALGDVALSRSDYAQATALYREAGKTPDAVNPLMLHVRLARSMAFDGGPEPLAHAAEALRLAKANPEATKDQIAGYLTIHARILLNQGQNRDAYDELKEALRLSGGLGLKVSQADVVLRSDLAVAAQLAGDETAAREYLVYTGAGRFEGGTLKSSEGMEPPVCGPETGLRPDDIAIVEFSIGSDGLVNRAETVFTRGSAEVAAQFARAVDQWVWDPATLEGIPPFFLRAIHVELRCTTQAQEVPDVQTPLNRRFVAWAAGTIGLADAGLDTAEALRRPPIDRLRAMAESGGEAMTGAKGVSLAGLLAIYEKGSRRSWNERIGQALAAAQGVELPREAANWLAFQAASRTDPEEERFEAPPETLLALLEKPEFSDDALAASTVRLVAVTEHVGRSQTKTRVRPELYQQVAADDRLPPHHPLRQLANLSLANIAAKERDFAAASHFFDETGLSEEQCALIGAQPSMRRLALRDEDYPSDAVNAGVEGFVRLEFDIQADGRTADVRTIVAYPPFMFNRAASIGIERSLYEPSFRPSGGAACTASRVGVAYRRAD